MDSFVGLRRIKENSNRDEIQLICQTLIQIIDDIMMNPSDHSKRRIKLDSEQISTYLMPYSGGMETLFEIGFEEDQNDEYLTLPITVKLDLIQNFRNELDSIKTGRKLVPLNKSPVISNQEPSTPVSQNTVKPSMKSTNEAKTNNLAISSNESDFGCTPVNQQCKTTLVPSQPAAPAAQRIKKRSFAVKTNNQKFANRLQSTYDHVLLYEQTYLKQKTRSLMPIEKFNIEAQLKFNAYKSSLTNEKTPYELRDFLLLELMDWFKNEFFKWVNQPDCDYCGSNQNMKFKHSSLPSSSENIWMAGNVEVYECREKCNKLTRFPRYNHPEKLLETRRGRCGEWANCFSLLLRSLDFDSRYILDWTDHVWCEVFSQSQQRWLHVDPCENIMDKPLIYEHGWGKKLSYIFAFSSYQCIDVTWRYTTKFKDVMARRQDCSETWLIRYANKLSAKRQVQFDKTRIQQIQMRLTTEIVEFLTPKTVKDGEDVGRQSGSLQWRLNRGEIKLPEAAPAFSFKIKESDLNSNKFRVQYNSVQDIYISSGSEIKCWKNGASKYKNIQHKVEHDWKMVYLSRTAGSDSAFIEWSFDLSKLKTGNMKKCIQKIELKLEHKCFENGKIDWTFYWSSKINDFKSEDKFTFDGKNKLFFDNLPFKLIEKDNEKELSDIKNPELVIFKIKATMSGGTGQNAWQHTQLFRQSLNDDKNLFDVCFHF